MSWTLLLTNPAEKQLRKINNSDKRRILRTLQTMQDDPLRGDIQWLEEMSPAYPRRVGNWRILFDLDRDNRRVIVTAVMRRTTTTYRKR